MLNDGLRQVVDTALLHLGCVRFPVTGPVRYSMTAREAVQLCRRVRPPAPPPPSSSTTRGWTHFRQERGAIEQKFQQIPADIGRRLQWLPIGATVSIAG